MTYTSDFFFERKESDHDKNLSGGISAEKVSALMGILFTLSPPFLAYLLALMLVNDLVLITYQPVNYQVAIPATHPVAPTSVKRFFQVTIKSDGAFYLSE